VGSPKQPEALKDSGWPYDMEDLSDRDEVRWVVERHQRLSQKKLERIFELYGEDLPDRPR
jgi:hypothetical protein